MSKFLVLSALLSLLGGEILGMGLLVAPSIGHIPYSVRPLPDLFSGQPMPYSGPGPTHFISPPTLPPSPPQEPSKDVEEVGSLVKALEDIASSLAQQTSTNSRSSSSPTLDLSNSVNIVGKQLSSEYLVTKGMGAHKLHLRKMPWNKARKICIDEGGNLATIASDAEEKIILEMLGENKIDAAWIGYHDMFEEGDWVSVLGEPLGKSGWDRWWKKVLPNPDNYENEDCASLCLDGGGINDRSCDHNLAFVCKITAL